MYGGHGARGASVGVTMRRAGFFGSVLVAIVLALIGPHAHAQQAQYHIFPRLTVSQSRYFQQHPAEYQQLMARLSQDAAQPMAPGKTLAPGEAAAAGTWANLAHTPNVALQNPLLMTDGTVIAQATCTGHWYKLTPDNTGSYINGTWLQIASMPSGYAPLFVGSGVLPDGRVIIEGGEYNGSGGNCGNETWTNLGAIYDPASNTWTAVTAPSGWIQIGDAAGVVLDNGTYMQSNCCDNLFSGGPYLSALFNPTNLTWTPTGTGKADAYDEEGFAKLQNGKLLDVDAYVSGGCGKNSELYNPSTGTWSTAGNTVDQEPDCSNPTNDPSNELGPLVLRQDGVAIIFPGLTCSADPNSNCKNNASGYVINGKADSYNASTGVWSTFATMPTVGGYTYSLDDAPAAVLPNGNVLIAASPSWQYAINPTHYFEVSLNGTVTQVGDTADAANIGAYEDNFLVLPTGQVLDVSQAGNIQIYTPLAGSPQPGWAPVVSFAPSCVSPGGTYVLSGSQLNGLTEGSYFGDDVQGATNFPLVKIVNNATGHVFYAKSFNHSTRSIAPGASVTTNFTVANATELGASTLYDVGGAIASAGTAINVIGTCPTPTNSIADTHDFNGDGKSDVLWRDTAGDVGMWLMNGSQVLQGTAFNSVPTNWSIVGQRDFNGDGNSDILWRDTAGDVGMWLMNGTQIVQGGSFSSIPLNWSVAGTGDFNADGKADILWIDNQGNIGIWFMNGTQILQAGVVGQVPANWIVVGSDMKGDIFLRNISTGEIGMWVMNGTKVSQAVDFGAVSLDWKVVGIGDFDGNGSLDLLWRNSAGDVAIWLMNGTNIMSSTVVGNLPTSSNIAQTGDYNGDGKSDILWVDNIGNVEVWFMNGASVSSVTLYGNVGTSWTVQSLGAD